MSSSGLCAVFEKKKWHPVIIKGNFKVCSFIKFRWEDLASFYFSLLSINVLKLKLNLDCLFTFCMPFSWTVNRDPGLVSLLFLAALWFFNIILKDIILGLIINILKKCMKWWRFIFIILPWSLFIPVITSLISLS